MFSLAAALLVTAAAAQAQGHSGDKGHGKDKGKDAKELRTDDRGTQGGSIWKGDRGDDRGTVNGNGQRIPPGLAKKPGGMPPGQYKKRYGTQDGASVLGDIFGRHGYTVVRTTNAGDSRYVYYRLRDGSVHRAIVSPGTDRLVFSNVPRSLLQEVLARLY
jgi:hypothetical protein